MFIHSILPALLAIALSTIMWRIVIGYLLKPSDTRRRPRRFLAIEPRWIGRRLAMLLYGRKSKRTR